MVNTVVAFRARVSCAALVKRLLFLPLPWNFVDRLTVLLRDRWRQLLRPEMARILAELLVEPNPPLEVLQLVAQVFLPNLLYVFVLLFIKKPA